MDKHTIEKKREAIIAEYNTKQRQAEERLDELKMRKRDVENCLEDIDGFRLSTKHMLNQHQSELLRHGAHEDLKMFYVVEEGLHHDCRNVANGLLGEQDEIERERKNVFRSLDDTEREYRHAMSVLKEEERV